MIVVVLWKSKEVNGLIIVAHWISAIVIPDSCKEVGIRSTSHPHRIATMQWLFYNDPGFFRIWPPNFLEALIKIPVNNLMSWDTSTSILKISWKNIDRWLRSILFKTARFWKIANWDIGDFVNFWQFFEPKIHILVPIVLPIV